MPSDHNRKYAEGVVEALRDAEADLSTPREVEHYLYFDDEAAARAAAEQVSGYRVEVEPSAGDDGRWLLLLTHEMVVYVDAFAEVHETLEGVAERHDGEYDGWEAEA